MAVGGSVTHIVEDPNAGGGVHGNKGFLLFATPN
jgi:hypothetical protein